MPKHHRKRARLTPSLAGVHQVGPPARRTGIWGVALIVVAVGVLSGVLFFALRSRQSNSSDRGDGQRRSTGAHSEVVPPGGAVSTVSVENKVADLVAEANDRMSKGNFQEAIDTYERALALSPKDEDLHYNLGIAHARAGTLTNAEHHYREALRLLPDYPEAHNNLGNLFLRLGRFDEAEKHFAEAIKILPEYASAHNNLGILRQRQQRLDEAQECFEKAVRYDPGYWQARFNLANSYLDHQEINKAVIQLREALRLNPSFEAAQRELDKLQKREPATNDQ